MSFQLITQMLMDVSNYQRNLQKSQKQMEGFGKSAKTIANGVKWAWAGVATLAFGAVGDAIVDVTKKFQEDQQSQLLLAKVVDNNVKGHKELKATIEQNISAWGLLWAVQDDKIRPAYAYLIRATHSVTKSNHLMKIAADLSAGAHIDLGAAASALGRAYNGNLTALNKLVPGVKKLHDPLAAVEKRFLGLAGIQANNDPFAKLSITMDEFKEKLGKSFYPIIKQIADYISSPKFQKQLDILARKFGKLFDWFNSKEGRTALKGWMDDLKALIGLAGGFLDMVKQVQNYLHPNKKKKVSPWAPEIKDIGNGLARSLIVQGGLPHGQASMSDNWKGNVTFNVYPTQVTGRAVVTELSKLAASKGIPMSKLLK